MRIASCVRRRRRWIAAAWPRSRRRSRVSSFALACGGYLLWRYDRLPFLPHSPGPLAQTWRRWRRRHKRALSDAEQTALLRDVHAALNGSAGETLYPSTLARLFERAPFLGAAARTDRAVVRGIVGRVLCAPSNGALPSARACSRCCAMPPTASAACHADASALDVSVAAVGAAAGRAAAARLRRAHVRLSAHCGLAARRGIDVAARAAARDRRAQCGRARRRVGGAVSSKAARRRCPGRAPRSSSCSTAAAACPSR